MDKFPIRVSIHCQHYVIYLGFYLYSVKLRQQYVANQLTSVILQYKQENKTKAQLYESESTGLSPPQGLGHSLYLIYLISIYLYIY